MVERVEEYPFSTLSGKMGLSPLLIPVAPDDILFDGNLESNIEWLNRLPSEENIVAMRAALRKSDFRLRRDLNVPLAAAVEGRIGAHPVIGGAEGRGGARGGDAAVDPCLNKVIEKI